MRRTYPLPMKRHTGGNTDLLIISHICSQDDVGCWMDAEFTCLFIEEVYGKCGRKWKNKKDCEDQTGAYFSLKLEREQIHDIFIVVYPYRSFIFRYLTSSKYPVEFSVFLQDLFQIDSHPWAGLTQRLSLFCFRSACMLLHRVQTPAGSFSCFQF